MSASKNILDHETDARFAAQTSYALGRKLDPSNPADALMMPLWASINGAVKAEDAAGKLVLTYNNPKVVQPLKDAEVAAKVTAVHLNAAASAPDPETARAHSAAASTAHAVGQQRARDAAVLQPPSVSPQIAAEVSKKARELPPPPPHAPPEHHLDMVQVTMQGNKAVVTHQDARLVHPRRPPVSTVHPHQVDDHRGRAIEFAHGIGAPYVVVIEMPDGQMRHVAYKTRAELDADYERMMHHRDQYQYVAAFDFENNPKDAPIGESVGLTDAPAAPDAPDTTQAPPAPSAEAPPSPDAQGGSLYADGKGRDAGRGRGGSDKKKDEDLVDPSTLKVKEKSSLGGGEIALICAGAALGLGLVFRAATNRSGRVAH